ncbi:MAG: DUF1636 domain-containing protein [Pseudomonadota bacterium]
MTTWITICDTCKRSDVGVDGTDGERLAALIETAAEGRVKTRRFGCLMGCARACNVVVQGAGKISYTLSEFVPEKGDAEAIVDYAILHQESPTGQVPYRSWPEGVKGHFAARHLPLPDDSER